MEPTRRQLCEDRLPGYVTVSLSASNRCATNNLIRNFQNYFKHFQVHTVPYHFNKFHENPRTGVKLLKSLPANKQTSAGRNITSTKPWRK